MNQCLYLFVGLLFIKSKKPLTPSGDKSEFPPFVTELINATGEFDTIPPDIS